LILAKEHDCRVIAFPSISTGIYGYPLKEAAPIALRTVKQFIEEHPDFDVIRFVLFDEETFHAYEKALNFI
jgi:O-acetyl-ADP-ribose deacetylase (regulator of RNase III)